jgi:hypothetical protein
MGRDSETRQYSREYKGNKSPKVSSIVHQKLNNHETQHVDARRRSNAHVKETEEGDWEYKRECNTFGIINVLTSPLLIICFSHSLFDADRHRGIACGWRKTEVWREARRDLGWGLASLVCVPLGEWILGGCEHAGFLFTRLLAVALFVLFVDTAADPRDSWGRG